MKDTELTSALLRARSVYARRPASAWHADSPASARWEQGLRVVTTHPSGLSVISDMPAELGGGGAEITPGWYARAGTAACAATCIAIAAALRGITLTRLEVVVQSCSDARGVLGMCENNDDAIDAAPVGHAVRVRLAGHCDPATLEALAHEGCRCSPIGLSLQRANPLDLQVEICA